MNYSDTVRQAICDLRVAGTLLTVNEAQRLRSSVWSKFAVHLNRPVLWEVIREAVSRYRPDGWLLACDFAGHGSPVLFFDEQNGTDMWSMETGDDLCKVLGDCPAMEFYLTDMDASYLLCVNHHDFIIGAGASVQWLAGVDDVR